jgi:hypothetical protein
MKMKIFFALTLVSLILTSLGCFESPTGSTCREDEPCWDCRTMGNQICGPNETSFEFSDDDVPMPYFEKDLIQKI